MMLRRSSSSQCTGSSSSSSVSGSCSLNEYGTDQSVPTVTTEVTTKRIMILPESIADNSQLNFISYPDPHSGHLKQYILSDDERNIYELNQTNEKYRGWFIDNTIQSDGSLYVCTPIDPLFLVLSAICNAKQSKPDKYCNIDVLLDYHGSPHTKILEKIISHRQLSNITDSKNMLNGDKVYRYDQNKTLTWLTKKIQLLAQTLKEESVYVGSGYCNTAYMNQTITQSTEEEYLHYACGMVQDYVPPLIADLLDEKYQKVKQQVEENPPSAKKPKIGISEPLEDYSNKTDHHHIMSVKTIPKLSAAQKALTKVNKKGMQKMTSFFTSKS